jgi:hypothetical protein
MSISKLRFCSCRSILLKIEWRLRPWFAVSAAIVLREWVLVPEFAAVGWLGDTGVAARGVACLN